MTPTPTPTHAPTPTPTPDVPASEARTADPREFAGKAALVTGGASGIGLAVARRRPDARSPGALPPPHAHPPRAPPARR
ncbi:hypothetical protein ACFV6U_36330, partial [Streptomyces sp. NPDC059810]